MGARNFQVFTIRYCDMASAKSMVMAICMNEVGDGEHGFLGCECMKDWGQLNAMVPDADIAFLREWCEAVRKEFRSSDTTKMAQESLKHCSANIDVSVSQITIDSADDPGTEMKKLFPLGS